MPTVTISAAALGALIMVTGPALAGTAQPLGPGYGTSGLTYTPFTEDMAYGGDSPWIALLGTAPAFVASDPNVGHEPYMRLGNGLARADLQQTVSREFSLSFRAIHTAFARGLWVGLFDDSGRRGYALLWDSALADQFNGQGVLKVLRFDLTQSLESFGTWAALPAGQVVANQLVPSGHAATYGAGNFEFARLQLNWDAASHQLTVVSGDDVTPRLTVTDGASWAGGWVPAFSRVYLRGNTDSYLDDVTVTMGRALQTLDGRTYVDERFTGSQRNGVYAASPFTQVDQPWTLLEGSAVIAEDLTHPGVAQLPPINVYEQGENANRELRLRFVTAGTRLATPIAAPLPSAAADPLLHISYDIRRESGSIEGGVLLVNAANASGSGGRGVGFVTEIASTNTLRLRVYTTADSGNTLTLLNFIEVTTPQSIANRIFPVAFEWNRATGAVSAAVDGGALQAVNLTAAQKTDLVGRASFSHAVLYSFGTQLRLDNVLVTGMPSAYVTSGNDVQAAINSAAGTSHRTVYLPPGTYAHAGALVANGVRVIGAGTATRLVQNDPASAQIRFTGVRPALRRLVSLTAVPDSDYATFDTRQNVRRGATAMEATVTFSSAQQAVVSDVVIERSRKGGIIFEFGAGLEIVASTVTATLADGIHLTHGTHDGRVFNNHVHFTGDDMIAIVSYRQKPDGSVTYPNPCHDDSVFQNVGNYNFWGRGVSVIGGTRVAQENNKVIHTMGSGLKIAAEASFFTYGVTTALARGNLILDSRGAAAALRSPGTGNDGLPDQINQAALDLDGAAGFPLQDVRLIHNTVDSTGAGGALVRASTAASNLQLVDNEFSAINLASGRTDLPVVWLMNVNAGPVLLTGNVFHDTSAPSHARWFIFNENSPGATNAGHGNIFQENHSDSGQFLSRQLGVTPEEQPH